MNKARVETKAQKLGYKLEDTGDDIRLEAPKGYCFYQDYHELVSEYATRDNLCDTTKPEAWKDVYEHIGQAEVCEIENCDWCGGR
jgi:hypothetical protein